MAAIFRVLILYCTILVSTAALAAVSTARAESGLAEACAAMVSLGGN